MGCVMADEEQILSVQVIITQAKWGSTFLSQYRPESDPLLEFLLPQSIYLHAPFIYIYLFISSTVLFIVMHC